MADNDALSQDELDALINSVSADGPAAAGDPPADAIADAGVVEGEPAGGYADPSGGYADPPGGYADPPGGYSDPDAGYSDSSSGASLRLSSFGAAPAVREGMNNFDRVTDIPLDLTVELGRTRLLIKDILELGSGSIVELEKTAGEPVDLLANGLLIARGEVVVIDDNFGVRITEIITSADRSAVGDGPSNKIVA